MAFKSANEYLEDKYGGLFILPQDKDSAEVVLLYQSWDDIAVADVHYIKSDDYSGYVHCKGKGCPLCAKGIKVQTKLFVPLFNINANNGEGEIQFFDRGAKFMWLLKNDIFSKCPNPSDYIIRIQRHGMAGDINTTYSLTLVNNNKEHTYAQICGENNVSFPDYYENIVKDMSIEELTEVVNSFNNRPSADGGSYGGGYGNGGGNTYVSGQSGYQAVPRVQSTPVPKVDLPSSSLDDFDAEIADGEVPF
jgi:hypothetical protein